MGEEDDIEVRAGCARVDWTSRSSGVHHWRRISHVEYFDRDNVTRVRCDLLGGFGRPEPVGAYERHPANLFADLSAPDVASSRLVFVPLVGTTYEPPPWMGCCIQGHDESVF